MSDVITKPIKEWTWEELIDNCTYAIFKQIMHGKLRDGVVDAFNMIHAWQKENGMLKK